MKVWLGFGLALLALGFSMSLARGQTAGPQRSPQPAAREELAQAWWTGPLLAPGAGTLPRGHMLIEPYLYDVAQYGAYRADGRLVPAQHANAFGSLTYVIYGVSDRFSVGAIPTFGYTTVSGGPSGSIGLGDWGVLAQYRLAQYHPGSWIPTTSVAFQETFPTGRFDRLGDRPSDGLGGGAYVAKASLYTQTYFWLANGRILRARLNLSDSFSSSVNLSGTSVYGTAAGFIGRALPGRSFDVDAAAEYSITQRWVFANDFVYGYTGPGNLMSASSSAVLDASRSFAVAPAIEYNWSANVGVIAGLRVFTSGVNTGASITPVVAINIVR